MDIQEIKLDLFVAFICFVFVVSLWYTYNKYIAVYRIRSYDEDGVNEVMWNLCTTINRPGLKQRLPLAVLQNTVNVLAVKSLPPHANVDVEVDERYDNEYVCTFTSKIEEEIFTKRLCALRQDSTGDKIYVFV